LYRRYSIVEQYFRQCLVLANWCIDGEGGGFMAAKGKQRQAKKINHGNLADVILKAFEYTADSVLILDVGGTIRYHNKAWLAVHAFGENEDFRGKNIRDVERKEILPLVNDVEKAVLKCGFFARQIGTVRRDGLYHDVHVSANLVRDSDPPRVVVIMREVTDLVQTQKKLERRNKELSILNEMHRIIISAKNQTTVIKSMLKLLGAYIDADIMSMYKADYAAGYGILVDTIGLPPRFKKINMKVPMTEIAFEKILKSSKTFVIEQDMPGYRGGALDTRDRLGVKKTVGFVFRTGGKEDHVAMFGLKREVDITLEMRTFLDTVANQFGIAIEKVELLDTIKERERELQKLTVQLISSGEEEKRRCSRMLHDEVGQALTGLRLEIDMLERNLGATSPCLRKSLEAIKSQVKFVSGTTRTLSKSLHPSMLEDLGLVETLNWNIDNVVRSDTLEVELEDAGFDDNPPLPVSIALYRVAQECLTNIMRHAHATKAKITLTKGYPYVIMVIEDNGRGISLAKGKSKTPGLGLVSMRERVEHMGGSFQFVSAPGKGTRVRVAIPIEAKRAR
jgi:PAS domain S-box-containing protein